MSQTSCIFCSIIQRSIPSTIIAENDAIIVIKDIAPKAPIHYLIIPKTHATDMVALVSQDLKQATAMLEMAKELSTHLSGSQAFRLVVNNGADAGQCVFHVHMHFLSGKQMKEF